MNRKDREPRRLGQFEKIQLATHVINHLAGQIHTVKIIQEKGGLTFMGMPEDSPQYKEGVLMEKTERLSAIIEELLDFSVRQELMNPIDWQIIKPGLEILLKGKDRVDGKEDPPAVQIQDLNHTDHTSGEVLPWE